MKHIQADRPAQIIQRVRSSVRSIIDLDHQHQNQGMCTHISSVLHINTLSTVIEAYSRSLRLVFISAIVMFVIVNALVFSIKLPHLKKKETSSEDGE